MLVLFTYSHPAPVEWCIRDVVRAVASPGLNQSLKSEVGLILLVILHNIEAQLSKPLLFTNLPGPICAILVRGLFVRDCHEHHMFHPVAMVSGMPALWAFFI